MSVRSFALPDPGEGLTEATIVRWRVSPGQMVTVNQILVEVETAKSLVELPSPWSGRVVQLAAADGETVPVGSTLVDIETPNDTPEQPAAPDPSAVAAPTTPAQPATSPVPPPVLAKPPVRALAKERGIDVATVRHSGP
ncbi:MAG: hypothetical protein LBH48_07500, partial [Bifidobacteriaceae bacterium]|nr:hypothetical protein [Bifidobacteriaceae bacterium]